MRKFQFERDYFRRPRAPEAQKAETTQAIPAFALFTFQTTRTKKRTPNAEPALLTFSSVMAATALTACADLIASAQVGRVELAL